MADAGVTTAATSSPLMRSARALARRPEAGVVLVILALGAFLTVANPRFLSLENLMNIARNYSDIGISAVGMTLVFWSEGSTFPWPRSWPSGASWRLSL